VEDRLRNENEELRKEIDKLKVQLILTEIHNGSKYKSVLEKV
jgi:hypothetical protein